MSSRKNNQTTSSRQTTSINGGKLPEFVSCELSDAEKAKVKENLLSVEECHDLLETLQNEGYRVALSHDGRSDCVGIYVTAVDSDHENYGYALSSRAPSLQGALTVLAFKHYDKLKEDWKTGAATSARDTWG